MDLRPSRFRADYPDWRLSYGIEEILREIHDANTDEWLATA